MKKSVYILLFLCTICLFSCFGFTCDDQKTNCLEKNAFRIIRKTNYEGKISLSYVFPLNQERLKEQNVDEKDISSYKFYLTSYVFGLSQNSKQKETENVAVSGVEYYQDIDGVGYTIYFDDINAQKEYFGVTDEGESSKPKSSGFFMKKTVYESTFPVSNQNVAGSLKLVCITSINAWAQNCNITSAVKKSMIDELSKSVYIYDFAMQSNVLKSRNFYEDEYFCHNVFVKTFDELDDSTIEFYTIYPNKPVWYLTATGVVFVAMATAFVVLKRKKLKKI